MVINIITSTIIIFPIYPLNLKISISTRILKLRLTLKVLSFLQTVSLLVLVNRSLQRDGI